MWKQDSRDRLSLAPLLEGDDVGVLELSQVFDLGLFDVPHFLHGNIVSVVLPEEDGSLGPAAHPLELRDLLERNLPGFWKSWREPLLVTSVGLRVHEENLSLCKPFHNEKLTFIISSKPGFHLQDFMQNSRHRRIIIKKQQQQPLLL